MNKLNLLLLAGAAAALTGCASEDVINSGDINPPTGGQAMSFGVLTGNHSRAADLNTQGHTDFGVFAYKGTDMANGLVMKNYQVKYEDTEKYGSHWQYDQVENQILKYWDYAFDNHYFVAYTPYAAAVTLAANDAATTDLKSTLTIPAAETFLLMSKRDDNEAMWCTQTVAKAAYGQEVPLTFNHLNAVIKLAFRSNIPGYTVKIKNLTGTNPGVQLTPATAAQAATPINWVNGGTASAKPEITQEYANKVTFTIADVFSSTAVPTTEVNSKVSHNLIFALDETNDGVTELEIPSVPSGSTDYLPLNSQFFALPLTDADAYKDEGDNHFATGYTLHVTYELIPNDGAATTTVHDARVFIPADKCKWAYGKLYLYRFTITTASSGVTDPETPIYNDGTTASPYVDIRDPRVPTDKALLPIVFDGVQVEGYENVVTYYNIN